MNLEHEDKGYQATGQSGVSWNTFDRTSCNAPKISLG